MNPLLIAVQNHSTVETDADVQARLSALDDFINLDVLPMWQVAPVRSVLVPKDQPIPANADRVELIADDATQAGALGWHSDSAAERIPTSYIFSRTSLQSGSTPSSVQAHERAETAIDPFIGYTVRLDLQMGGFRGGYVAMVMLEGCDGPEADQFGYKRNGVALSNVVSPAWFGLPYTIPSGFAGHQYDFVGNVSGPFGIDARGIVSGLNPGGYIALCLLRVQKDWFQVTASHAPAIAALETLLPPGEPHVLCANGARLDPKTVCPFSRRGRWLKKHTS